MVEAVQLLAKTEGILLDPVYTGKAVAGLIDLIRKGNFNKEDNILFVHSGGSPLYMRILLYLRKCKSIGYPMLFVIYWNY